MPRHPAPLPLFDTIANFHSQQLPGNIALPFAKKDFKITKGFLTQYAGNKQTFKAYRRELERLIQWSWLVLKKPILKLTRDDIVKYIEFCLDPPKSWTGFKHVSRFILKNGSRTPNPEWKLFVVNVPKSKVFHKKNKQHEMSQAALSATFAILQSFYNYLLSETLIKANPVALVRQKSKYLRKHQDQRKIRRLSDLQWNFATAIITGGLKYLGKAIKNETSPSVMKCWAH